MFPEDGEDTGQTAAPKKESASSRDQAAPTPLESAPARDDERPQGTPIPGSLIQHRALNAVEEIATAKAASDLLGTTGPHAELKKAEIRGVITEARRRLINSKGAGVVFEARMVARAQHAGERFAVANLRASLAAGPTDPIDVVLGYQDGAFQVDLRLQLKTGSDPYIRASLRKIPDGTLVLVPCDVPTGIRDGRTLSEIPISGTNVETPTRTELRDSAGALLDRLSTGSGPVDFRRVAREAFRASLVDGLVAAVVDLCAQRLASPGAPPDWNRTARAVAKTVASSALGAFLAASHATSAVVVGRHSLDAAVAYRTVRVAACVVPHAIDAAFDFASMNGGTISPEDFGRRLAGHTGAAAAEMLAFKYLARLAAGFGPLGQAVVMIGGGFLVSKLGEKFGGFVFDVISAALPPLPTELPSRRNPQLSSAVRGLLRRQRLEDNRRSRRAKKGLCEEPFCGREHHARGMCARHYQRWWRKERRSGWRPIKRARRSVKGSTASGAARRRVRKTTARPHSGRIGEGAR